MRERDVVDVDLEPVTEDVDSFAAKSATCSQDRQAGTRVLWLFVFPHDILRRVNELPENVGPYLHR